MCHPQTFSHRSEHYQQGHLRTLEKTRVLILSLVALVQILMPIVSFCHSTLHAVFDLQNNSESTREGFHLCHCIATCIVDPHARPYQMPVKKDSSSFMAENFFKPTVDLVRTVNRQSCITLALVKSIHS